jgi:hypothetical protein
MLSSKIIEDIVEKNSLDIVIGIQINKSTTT